MVRHTWGTPNMVKHGINPELLLAGKYGSKLHVWDLRRRRHLQELHLAPNSKWCSSCDRLTTRRAPTDLPVWSYR